MVFRKIFWGGPRFEAEWVVLGLGNPGEEHARNRHNVGFWVVNELARRTGAQVRTTGGLMAIGTGAIAGHQVALVKPRTFVNLSGKAAAQALRWTGCAAAHTVVVYDELDMGVGALRVRAGGGHGGHNGLKSVGASIGSDFVRVRIGIGRPLARGEPSWDSDVVAEWVLSNPQGEDRRRLEEAALVAADAVEAIVVDGAEAAASRFNRR